MPLGSSDSSKKKSLLKETPAVCRVGQTHTVDLRAEKREFFQFHPWIPGKTTS